MKHLICAACLLVVAAVASPQRVKYTTKYDNVDVDRIIKNDRILTSYIKCMMDEGPCTAEGRELKKTLPDALKSDCNGCNENQKETAERVINHMRTKRARDWDRLMKKYDPTGIYKKRFDSIQATAATTAKTETSTPKGGTVPKAPATTASSTVKVTPKVKAPTKVVEE